MLQTNTELVIVLICTVQCFTLAVNISGGHVKLSIVTSYHTYFTEMPFNVIHDVK